MARILYISPIARDGRPVEGDLSAQLAREIRPGNQLASVEFRRGPRHLEYHYYEALVVPDLVHTVIEAEARGFDAAVIGCFYDLGLHASREMARRIVVTAPCEASVLLAASLGHRFSIIVGRRKWIPQMHDNVRAYGLDSRLASFRALELGVPDYHADEAETTRRFREASRRAVEEDDAEVIILGCTASAGFYRDLQADLGVPVIDSAIAAVKQAEQLVELRDRFGWLPSRVGGYESPPPAEVEGWDLRAAYPPTAVSDVWEPQPGPNGLVWDGVASSEATSSPR